MTQASHVRRMQHRTHRHMAGAYEPSYEPAVPSRTDPIGLFFARLIIDSNPIVSGPEVAHLDDMLHRWYPHAGRLYIMKSQDKDAFCLPTGDIFMSTALAESLTSNEQLRFILGHELSHVRKARERAETSKTLREYVHQARLEEYKGDITGFLDVAKDASPLEGIAALEKIQSSSYGGPVHGDTIHRILNMHWLTHLIDFEHISRTPEKFSISFASAPVSSAPNIRFFENLLQHPSVYRAELRKCTSLHAAIAVYQHAFETFWAEFGRDEYDFVDETPTMRQAQSVLDAVMLTLEDRCTELLDERHAPVVAEIIKGLCCGDNRVGIRLSSTMIDTLDARLFSQLGIVATYREPTYVQKYAESLAQTARDPALVEQVQERLKKLTDVRGLVLREPDRTRDDFFSRDYSDVSASVRFKASYLDTLERLPLPEVVSSLHEARRHYDMFIGGVLLVNFGDGMPITPNFFRRKRGMLSPDAELAYLTVMRAVFGDELNRNIYCMNIVTDTLNNTHFTNDGFARAVDVIVGDKLQDEFPAVVVPRLAPYIQQDFLNAIRVGRIDRALRKKDYENVIDIIEHAHGVYPKLEPPSVHRGSLNPSGKFYLLPDDLRLRTFFSFLLPEVEAAQVQRELIPRYLAEQPFADAVDFLVNYSDVVRSAKPFEYVMEERARSIEELELAAKIPERMVESLGRDHSTELSSLMALEYYHRRASADRLDFVCAALDRSSSYKLKRTVANAMIRSCRDYLRSTAEDDPDLEHVVVDELTVLSHMDNIRNEAQLEEPNLKNIMPPAVGSAVFDELDKLYGLDVAHRYGLIRVLLADSNQGILVREEYRQRLVPELLGQLVHARTKVDRKALGMCETILDAFIYQAPLSQSYFLLLPLLMEHMLQRPSHDASDRQAVADAWLAYWFPQWAPHLTSPQQKRFTRKVMVDMNGPLSTDYIAEDICRQYRLTTEAAKSLSELINEASAFHQEEKGHRSSRKLRVVEFLKLTARNLGSAGTRFMQLFGQFAHIPAEYEAEFQDVYDNLRGQSKVTAYMTVCREFPRFREEYASLDEMLGGGSLSTVYRATRTDGQERAVKVLNPNLTYFNSIAFGILETILCQLATQNSEFAIGKDILEDIREWVERDSTFTGFKELDDQFYAMNNSFEGVGGYRIRVPRTELDNPYIKIEEYMEGTNLTKPLERKHDRKAICATIARNYLAQLQNGLVHSDVHPGNFRVSGRDISILDRNYYLEFDEKERAGLQRSFYAAAIGDYGCAADFIAEVSDYKGARPIREIVTQCTSMPDDMSLPDRMLAVVRNLRSESIRPPLKYTLIIRNIHSINKMCRQAGFAGIEDALTYAA